jgi:hypothetical protein
LKKYGSDHTITSIMQIAFANQTIFNQFTI